MTIQLGIMTYYKRLPPTVPWTTKLGRLLTYFKGLLSIKSHDPLITWSCEITRQTKNHVSLVLIATEIGRVVTYYEELALIKLHDTSITWFLEVTNSIF